MSAPHQWEDPPVSAFPRRTDEAKRGEEVPPRHLVIGLLIAVVLALGLYPLSEPAAGALAFIAVAVSGWLLANGGALLGKKHGAVVGHVLGSAAGKATASLFSPFWRLFGWFCRSAACGRQWRFPSGYWSTD